MLRSVKIWGMAAAMTFIVVASAWAAADAVATGKWTWKATMGQGGGEIEVTLDLKQGDDGKLTGTISRGDMKIEIKEGTIKDGTVSFITSVERNGMEFKSQYKGKLDGDKITGNITTMRNGQERTRDWTATRSK